MKKLLYWLEMIPALCSFEIMWPIRGKSPLFSILDKEIIYGPPYY